MEREKEPAVATFLGSFQDKPKAWLMPGLVVIIDTTVCNVNAVNAKQASYATSVSKATPLGTYVCSSAPRLFRSSTKNELQRASRGVNNTEEYFSGSQFCQDAFEFLRWKSDLITVGREGASCVDMNILNDWWWEFDVFSRSSETAVENSEY